ncbi:MAG: hypothetical protein V1720_10780 [bacterium]
MNNQVLFEYTFANTRLYTYIGGVIIWISIFLYTFIKHGINYTLIFPLIFIALTVPAIIRIKDTIKNIIITENQIKFVLFNGQEYYDHSSQKLKIIFHYNQKFVLEWWGIQFILGKLELYSLRDGFFEQSIRNNLNKLHNVEVEGLD